MRAFRSLTCFFTAALASSGAVFFAAQSQSFAQKTEADMIPPDVTLTTSSASTRTTTGSAGGGSTITSAPGLAGAAGGQAAGAGSATPPNTAPAGPRPPASAGGTYLNAHPNANPANTTPSSIPAHGAGIFRGSGVKPDPAKPDPIATLETSKGVIKIMLFRKLAPITVENFIDLCSKGFYNGKTFHRVEPGFVIQGGDPMGNGQGDYIDPSTHQIRYLPLETSPSLKHNAPGVVAMARKGQSLDSASCQFYITLAACPQLDGKYAVFGGVVSGLDVVQKIAIGDKILTATVEEQQ